MGDKVTLTKARMELEDMYQGIPDESVNLTFQDFAELKLNKISSSSGKNKKPPPLGLEPSSEFKSPSPLTKLPSLDFNRALQASRHHHINENDVVVGPYAGSRGGYNHHDRHHAVNIHHGPTHGYADHNLSHNNHYGHAAHGYGHDNDQNLDHNNHHGHAAHDYGRDDHEHHRLDHNNHHGHGSHAMNNHSMDMANPGPTCGGGGMRHGLETSLGAYDHDVSGVSMASSAMYNQQERGGRRPGVPHSNICTICSTYIYIFRHRCLVCGRVYCSACVMVGMGEMTEGRKCVECLGRRFSQRYIQRAGKVGCFSRYPRSVKQAELKWAEKGPRRSGNGEYGRSSVLSPRSKSPVTPRTPNSAHTSSSPNSFVMNRSSYSPYSPSNGHHLPF